MQKTFFLALAVLATTSAFAQTPANHQTPATPQPAYSADSFLLRSNGPRISLFSFCPAYGYPGRAVYFRKDQDSAYHRVSIRNLRVALADNPGSMQELRIAGTNIGVGIGLLAGGIALSTIGILTTVHHNKEIDNAYKQASAQWYAQAQANPFGNNPAPTLPHTAGLSALFYLGTAMTLSAIIPLANTGKHAQKAINIYNQ